MENTANTHPDINGWGIDANAENDPTYPMRDRTNAESEGYRHERPVQQAPTVEILQSIERPSLSAVYGTSAPPSGLSGQIRRYAFRYSESSWGHWLPLLLADRINAVEGIIDDLKQGRIPNIFVEKGWKAQWQYNRKAVVQKVLVGAVLAAVAIAWLSRNKRKSHKR